jgi:hypothetical protein
MMIQCPVKDDQNESIQHRREVLFPVIPHRENRKRHWLVLARAVRTGNTIARARSAASLLEPETNSDTIDWCSSWKTPAVLGLVLGLGTAFLLELLFWISRL